MAKDETKKYAVRIDRVRTERCSATVIVQAGTTKEARKQAEELVSGDNCHIVDWNGKEETVYFATATPVEVAPKAKLTA
jgi:hypothetical protein